MVSRHNPGLPAPKANGLTTAKTARPPLYTYKALLYFVNPVMYHKNHCQKCRPIQPSAQDGEQRDRAESKTKRKRDRPTTLQCLRDDGCILTRAEVAPFALSPGDLNP